MGITHATTATGTDAGTGDIHKAQWNAAHIVELDYVEITTGVTISATTEAGATTLLTGSAVTYDGSTVVMVECFFEYVYVSTNTAGKGAYLTLYDGASSIGILSYADNP